jgi:hypothetical protein
MNYSQLISNGYYFQVFKPFVQAYGLQMAAYIGLLIDKQHYWDLACNKDKTQNGFWFHSADKIRAEIGVPVKTQQGFRIQLEDAGAIETKKMGTPARIWYRLNWDNYQLLVERSVIELDAPIPISLWSQT